MPRRIVLALLVLALLGLVAVAPTASAASEVITHRVTTTADTVNGGDGLTSLREAVLAADEDGADSRIVLGIDATYLLTRCAPEAPDLGQQGSLTTTNPFAVPTSEADGFDLEVQGRGSTIEQTCPGETVWRQLAYSHLLLRDLTVTGGESSGVYVASGFGVSAYDVTFRANSSPSNGGGLLVSGGGSGTLVRTTFEGNQAPSGGGAWVNGPVTVRNSTFSGNGEVGAEGGAIRSPNEVNLRDTTISGNTAASGAAIFAGSVIVYNSTIVGDLAAPGGAIRSTGNLLIAATIVQPASGAACDVAGTPVSNGWNRTPGANDCGIGSGTSDQLATVALGPLAANGGPTQTRLPRTTPGPGQVSVVGAMLVGTPHCDQGGSDQRYVEVPQGSACEIGAVEVPNPFSDVGAGNLFFAEIAWMDDAEVTTGFPDGTYKPSSGVTRSAMAAFLFRLSGDEGSYTPPGAATFPDVSTAHPFFLEVEWLEDSGITGGYDDGTFRPSSPVTRQAMAAFVYRFEGEPLFTDPAAASFSDVGPGHPFFSEIEWMADEGISAGYVGGTWRPSLNVSRQAMARFLFVAQDVGNVD